MFIYSGPYNGRPIYLLSTINTSSNIKMAAMLGMMVIVEKNNKKLKNNK